MMKLPRESKLNFRLNSFSGARFGLRVTLNIEQYEYMIGPNTDAGIKVRSCN